MDNEKKSSPTANKIFEMITAQTVSPRIVKKKNMCTHNCHSRMRFVRYYDFFSGEGHFKHELNMHRITKILMLFYV